MNEQDEALLKENDEFLLEKERLTYCEKLYAQEIEKKERLEKKAQFYISLTGLFLAVISLKGGMIALIGPLLAESQLGAAAKAIIFVEVAIFAAAIFGTLISIIRVLAPQPYRKPHPRKLVSSLFSPATAYYDDQDTASLLRSNAMKYALAIEVNNKSNAIKSKWLTRASCGALVSLISFALLLSTLIFLSLTRLNGG